MSSPSHDPTEEVAVPAEQAEAEPAAAHRAAAEPAGEPRPGRPVVLEPTPPGLWRVLLGVAVAALAPLFGFLVGGVLGPGDPDASIDPISTSLFVGILVGGLGVLVAVLGGVRLWRHNHREDVADEKAGLPAGVGDVG